MFTRSDGLKAGTGATPHTVIFSLVPGKRQIQPWSLLQSPHLPAAILAPMSMTATPEAYIRLIHAWHWPDGAGRHLNSDLLAVELVPLQRVYGHMGLVFVFHVLRDGRGGRLCSRPCAEFVHVLREGKGGTQRPHPGSAAYPRLQGYWRKLGTYQRSLGRWDPRYPVSKMKNLRI